MKKVLCVVMVLLVAGFVYANVEMTVTITGDDTAEDHTTNTYEVIPSGTPTSYTWSVYPAIAGEPCGVIHPVAGAPDNAIYYPPEVPPGTERAVTIRCEVYDNQTCDYGTGEKNVTVIKTKPVPKRQPKGVQWINYSQPKTKGDDNDRGTQPAYYPAVEVNNVSLTPAVSIKLFDVALPFGNFDISPVLTYTPPTLTSKGVAPDKVFSLNAPGSTLGNCWSHNLEPCVTKSWSMLDAVYALNVGVESAPLPGVSMGKYLEYYPNSDAVWDDCEPYPQSRASIGNDAIEYWGSGHIIDLANDVKTKVDTSGIFGSYTKYQFPKYIKDRWNNQLVFSYAETPTTCNDNLSDRLTYYDIGQSYYFKVQTVALAYSDMSLVFVYDAYNRLTVIKQMQGTTELRRAEFVYETSTRIIAKYYSKNIMSVKLLNKIIIKGNYQDANDDATIEFTYGTTVNQSGSCVAYSIPYLTKIETPSDEIDISYTDGGAAFGFYGPADYQQLQPERVTVTYGPNDDIVDIYEREGVFNYNDAELNTTTAQGTVNNKKYSLYLNPLTLQWYGAQKENTLDSYKQAEYETDERFNYTTVRRYPYSGESYEWNYEFDQYDNVTKEIDPRDNETQYVYAQNGMDLLGVTDRNGRETTNDYKNGSLHVSIKDIDTLKQTVIKQYNVKGQLISDQDPLQNITYYFYSESRVPGPITSYDYETPDPDDFGWLMATRDPEGKVTMFTYDAFGRKKKIDAPGTASQSGGRYIIENSYDYFDRLTSTWYPDDTWSSNVYATTGYPQKTRDRAGRWTQFTYDSAGHMLSVTYPNGDTVTKTYNCDLVETVVDGEDNTTAYYYDHEQLVRVTFPDGSKRAAGFDNLNRHIWAVDERGVLVTNSYDDLNNLRGTGWSTYGGSPSLDGLHYVTDLPELIPEYDANAGEVYGGFNTVAYNYDKEGNLTWKQDWVGITGYTYDNLYRVTVEAQTNNSRFYPEIVSQVYQYDIGNNREALDVTCYSPGETFSADYAYDDLNRPETISWTAKGNTIATSYAYDDNGKLLQRSSDSGTVVTDYEYDSEQRLKDLDLPNISLSYTYNQAQQIARITEAGEYVITNSYDGRDQLVEEEELLGPLYHNTYLYDDAQNRIDKNSTDTYNYNQPNANKLDDITVGGSATHEYTYDSAGNLKQRVVNSETTTFKYDARNKLVFIEYGDDRILMVYDSNNRRVKVSYVTGATGELPVQHDRHYIHDGDTPVATLYSHSTTEPISLEKVFARGIGIAEITGDVIAEIDGQNDFVYYGVNHRGDTVATFDTGGSLTCQIWYDAFGNIVQSTPSADLPFYTFSTKEYLADVALYLYQYRVYDPIAGRWTQRDPIDYQDSENLYQFCGNNPVNNVDEFGLLSTNPEGKYVFIQGDVADIKGYGPGHHGKLMTEKQSPIPAARINIKDASKKSNCHGYTFTEGQYLIDPRYVKIILDDEYEESAAKNADIVIFKDKKNKVIHHSEKVTGQTKDGKTKTKGKMNNGEIRESYAEDVADANDYDVEYYKKVENKS